MDKNIFAVGQQVPDLLASRFQQDGAQFAIDLNRNFYLCISFTNPTKKEIKKIKNDIIRFRFYEKKDVIYPLVCFGKDLSCEIPYNPVNTSLVTYEGLSNGLHIVLADTQTKIIRAQKTIGLGTEFMYYLIHHWNKAIRNKEWEQTFFEMYQNALKSHVHKLFLNAPISLDWDK
ncbi:hypothetical protein [Evansella cellulosilytica]|uniref:Uncharacterized protein n=1 Tax=Evansella cellulosilytica (strain ATCC 21833 / DSM 2522 / FERM P-1141 / JCM 9156 / N-4) TaxID=649639 RepID=E6TTC5_EVAC2|nr:hypothetical protein [Evansella cellulosilytica]ADU28465.1 hypothetical protein Bcell_0176 [Evansella cellulosilytica DSM 2522]